MAVEEVAHVEEEEEEEEVVVDVVSYQDLESSKVPTDLIN